MKDQFNAHVCTMRLYGIEENYGLIFTTRNFSRKWSNLIENPNAAICILHPGYQLQLQIECSVKLLTSDDEPNIRKKYWSRVRPDVKKIYHAQYLPNIEYRHQPEIDAPIEAPKHFGIIAAIPYSFEYLFINEDYQNSIRYHYSKNMNENWSRRRLTVS